MFAAAVLVAARRLGAEKYDAGARDTEIKLANIMPYSGLGPPTG
jgi:hypothetical protein